MTRRPGESEPPDPKAQEAEDIERKRDLERLNRLWDTPPLRVNPDNAAEWEWDSGRPRMGVDMPPRPAH
jgi:hypothetical protein